MYFQERLAEFERDLLINCLIQNGCSTSSYAELEVSLFLILWLVNMFHKMIFKVASWMQYARIRLESSVIFNETIVIARNRLI